MPVLTVQGSVWKRYLLGGTDWRVYLWDHSAPTIIEIHTADGERRAPPYWALESNYNNCCNSLTPMPRRKKNGGRKRQYRARDPLVGIKQGTGRSVGTAFGSRRGSSLRCWDAFAPQHLALPRPVAPYLTIRTTQLYKASTSNDANKFHLFGPMMNGGSTGAGDISTPGWTNAFMLGPSALAGALTTSFGSTTELIVRSSGFNSVAIGQWGAATVVPSAFSVQVMNPEALQTTNGIVYIGRAKNRINLATMTNTNVGADNWSELANDLVSYTNPRLCSAAKLAMRGVQVDAVPNNMNELANFTQLSQFITSTQDQTASGWDDNFAGFNPIWVYNPDGVELQYLISCEWRVRFDPSHPAHAAAVHHAPSTDRTWSDLMGQAVSLGNGVIDIVERVAETGRALAPVVQRMLPAANALPAIAL